jgi:hypothetical protein
MRNHLVWVLLAGTVVLAFNVAAIAQGWYVFIGAFVH